MVEFARIWRRVPKVVFSSTLDTVDGNTRLVSGDVGDELARLRTEFDGDLDLGGPTLASAFICRAVSGSGGTATLTAITISNHRIMRRSPPRAE